MQFSNGAMDFFDEGEQLFDFLILWLVFDEGFGEPHPSPPQKGGDWKDSFGRKKFTL